VLLYSKRVSRRIGARTVAVAPQLLGVTEPPPPPPAALPEPATLLLPAALGMAWFGSMVPVQAAAAPHVTVSAKAEKGFVNPCMTTFRLVRGPVRKLSAFECPRLVGGAAPANDEKCNALARQTHACECTREAKPALEKRGTTR
jgi:hypothetical protein